MPEIVERPPRIQPELPIDEIEIPAPPKIEQEKQPLWQSLVPVVTILGYVIVSASGQGSTNISFLIPMALAVFVSTGVALYNVFHIRSEATRKQRDYDQRLVELRKEMVTAQDKQRFFYQWNYPEPGTVLKINGKTPDTRGGSRLWERRSEDEDFGLVRLGIGTMPSTVIYKVAQTENEENPQMREAERLAEDALFVTDVPITIPLYEHYVPDKTEDEVEDETKEPEQVVPGTIGIALPKDSANKPEARQALYAFVNSLLTHFVAFHAPTDAQLFILGTKQAETRWRWTANLPHCKVGKTSSTSLCFDDEKQTASDDDMDGTKDKVSLYWKSIWSELERRARRLRDSDDKDNIDVTLPFMLIVVDLLDLNENSSSALRNMESEAALSLLMQQGKSLGAGVLFLVPERSKVPSGCRAVIELISYQNQSVQPVHSSAHTAAQSIKLGDEVGVRFLYAEIGLNTPRYVGQADAIWDPRALAAFAAGLAECEVRRSYGTDLPRGVDMLEMNHATTIENLEIHDKWVKSLRGGNYADWIKVTIGHLSGNEPRTLKFSADADGVHGMVAGSTGSGKSELLMTLILGLAIRYDPSIVNFVLVDYKGGSAFDPFDNLPHTVDKVTNLSQGAVARMFAAINAELNRRQTVNRDTDSKHIVQYRKRGLHLKRRDNYAHLFIIIDEFAEMIANNAEYKAQLDSITRLGRSLGVSLILAAQRPSGVTDQMRANIKFRICLRVETKDESNELLRRPDAAYLPNGVPGRGYLQVGNDNLQEIQIAYTGDDYSLQSTGEEQEILKERLNRYGQQDVIWLDTLEVEPPKLYEVLVDYTKRMAELTRDELRFGQKPRKPWPSPLPGYMSLDEPEAYAIAAGNLAAKPVPIEVEYLRDEDQEFIRYGYPEDTPFTLSPAINGWVNGNIEHWENVEWENRAMRAVIGLIDDPSNAKLQALRLNLVRGHYVLFGAAGWGKSTFLRTLITSLIATHSPQDLNLYILDFGNRNLEVFKEENLRHTGAYILAQETERVQRLIRWLDEEIERRKAILSAANATNLYNYNEVATERLPAILVIIDNFVEFKTSFEPLLEVLGSLIREGLSMGVHFVVTADQVSAVGKLYSLFSERMTLKLAEDSEYSSVVGRGARFVEELPGRGFVTVGRSPLEFQVAVPLGVTPAERQGPERINETTKLLQFVEIIQRAGKQYPEPQRIGTLPERVELRTIFSDGKIEPQGFVGEKPLRIAIGKDDANLDTKWLPLTQKLHFLITGQPSSGKSMTLYNLILTLAYTYSPEDVQMVLIDFQGKLGDYGGQRRIDDLPHVLGSVISNKAGLLKLAQHLEYEFGPDGKNRTLLVIFDNYDDAEDLFEKDNNLKQKLGNLARRFGKKGLHFVVCGSQNALKSSDDLTRPLAATRFGLAMDIESAGSTPLNGRVPRSFVDMKMPLGRGFIVESGRVSVVQVASVYEKDMVQELDAWVGEILSWQLPPADWLALPEDTEELALEPVGQPATTASGNGANHTQSVTATTTAPVAVAASQEAIKKIREALAADMSVPVEALTSITDEGIIEMAQRRNLA
ncbi:MAG: FtsK/SpoIIIE domain-containing protein [Chloroflexota bacterium]